MENKKPTPVEKELVLFIVSFFNCFNY